MNIQVLEEVTLTGVVEGSERALNPQDNEHEPTDDQSRAAQRLNAESPTA